MATFHERFLQLYQETQTAGLKQKEFAARCGATQGQVHGWIRGTSAPSPDMLARIAVGNEISLYWLLGLSDLKFDANIELQEYASKFSRKQVDMIKVFMEFIIYLETTNKMKKTKT